MQYTLFTGCSYTAGTGFDLLDKDDNLWVNLLHKTHQDLSKTEKINDSAAGRSNSNIFSRTVYNLTHYDVKYAFVQWTGFSRLEFSTGLETYSTRQVFMPNLNIPDHNLNDITYSKRYLESVQNRILALMHEHYEIVKLIEYINSLLGVCNATGTKIFFINGLCPWDNNFFSQLSNSTPNDYTSYTKKLININKRDDDEIFKLYKKIHSEYNALGGIRKNHWLNLYSSLRGNRIDTNNDNLHPGIKSNQNTSHLLLDNLFI